VTDLFVYKRRTQQQHIAASICASINEPASRLPATHPQTLRCVTVAARSTSYIIIIIIIIIKDK